MANAKGMKALHGEVESKEGIRSRTSISDGIVQAIREVTGFPTGGALSAQDAVNLVDYPDEQAGGQRINELPPELQPRADLETFAEQSKPVDREPSPAPSLYVPGMEAIRQAGAATEQDRVREYGLLAEIDAKLSANDERSEQLNAVIVSTTEVLDKAKADMNVVGDEHMELAKQRAETVDRIVKLNQTAIDHEAARLRRG